ncbi:hypothetical protein [Metabacillus indicus]|uniref:hypothetical protein n=1 Tax=Metabacillus indicus TaxID=246786 RepID=UPI0004932EF7|nr:hypothetical protein [Metabacillus indicus]KEZ51343.1 hypothetical protein AZ46_0212260 [Metabacillus indicus LMG 22858]
MSYAWLHNSKIDISIVTINEKDYIVYLTKVGSIQPKLVEEIETGKRIRLNDVRDEITSINPNAEVDEMIIFMINKLQ